MNTNLSAKRILLYGDSLVFGKASGRNERLDAKTRFSGVLQDLLGDEFEVIEEGLRARMIEGESAFFPDRDGLQQFSPILGSQLPVDLVVIFLGTNDCNAKAQKTPQDIAASLRKYPPIIQEWCTFMAVPLPKLLIIAPPAIDQTSYDEPARNIFGSEAASKAEALPAQYALVAKELGAIFFDSSAVCKPATGDGIHLDEANNQSLANALEEVIRQALDA
jgi:lysophospholipase L1-like esterase